MLNTGWVPLGTASERPKGASEHPAAAAPGVMLVLPTVKPLGLDTSMLALMNTIYQTIYPLISLSFFSAFFSFISITILITFFILFSYYYLLMGLGVFGLGTGSVVVYKGVWNGFRGVLGALLFLGC